jgi:hypothetical protein
MPVIKLFIEAESLATGSINVTTAISVVPVVNRYTATVVIGNILGGVTTIPAQNFTDDNGTSIPAGSLSVPTSNGYYNLYINGDLQRGGLSTLSSSSLIINTALVIGLTVVVEVINFTSAATSTSTNNLVVTTSVNT